MKRLESALPILVVVAVIVVVSDIRAADGKLSFEKDILPIVKAKCIRCHAGVEPKAGLNLTEPSSLLAGGKSRSALRIGAAEFSLLYEMVSSDKMPPVGQKLSAKEKGLIRKWINDGAVGVDAAKSVDADDGDDTATDLWSFQPPVRPDVPRVSSPVRNPIDAFVIHKLQAAGLDMAPAADRVTLLRRASFDLIGLPPSAAEVRTFLADDRPEAYERMVDRLLASPHYGERWGRHWLDVAGYAESAGILNEDRPLPLAWRYRDYVIQSFNNDKPYDRFLQEQIAGDELTEYWAAHDNLDRLPDDVVDGITATGFLRTAADPSRPDFKTIKNAAAQYFYPTIFDTVQIVCSSTMGLTVQCARCHSHKFDPIPQTDYFRMQAVFMGAYRPDNWVPQMNRRLQIASQREKDAAAKHNAAIDARIKQLKDELAKLKQTFTTRLFDERLAVLPAQIRDDVKQSLDLKPDARNEVQKYLADKFAKTLRPAGKELDAALAKIEDYVVSTKKLNGEIAAEDSRRRHFDEVRALYDLPGEVKASVLLRGDPLVPGPPVEPGVISTLSTPREFAWQSPEPDAKTTGRRLAFARWLTQPRHPLTARVMVNRIWMHHFDTGIVATPDDFGVSGDPPSHPRLLDWLATEFVRNGWSIKHMHRLILTSRTWRQHSRVSDDHRAAGNKVDPNNRLLWRLTMRRLEAEPLRDAVMAVAGTLSTRMHGASERVARQRSGEVIISSNANRRSVYTQILRLNPETMLEIFDQPTISVNCTKRSTSTVSTQALALLNSEAMTRAATSFANQVRQAAPDSPVAHAVMAAFGRPATPTEKQSITQALTGLADHYLTEQPEQKRSDPNVINQCQASALRDVCHMLLSANEFVYID